MFTMEFRVTKLHAININGGIEPEHCREVPMRSIVSIKPAQDAPGSAQAAWKEQTWMFATGRRFPLEMAQ
jgi:hypothetical protein